MTNSDCSGTGSSYDSDSSSDSVSGLKFELGSSFKFDSGGIDVMIDIIGSNVGIVEGDTNNTLRIKEDVGMIVIQFTADYAAQTRQC